MHPRIREIIDHLDASHRELREAFDEVPVPLRERRPSPDCWSVTEIVDHLAVVEERVAGLLAGALADVSALGEERDTTPVLPTLPVDQIASRAQKFTASEPSQPKGRDAAAAWAALEEQRGRLRDTILAADGRALGEIRLPHPRLGELNAYQWVLFAGAHERRHAAQMREIAEALRGA